MRKKGRNGRERERKINSKNNITTQTVAKNKETDKSNKETDTPTDRGVNKDCTDRGNIKRNRRIQ